MTGAALLALAGAIVSEVTGTVSLRLATGGGKRWWVGAIVGYVLAFVLLSVVLSHGVPLGVAYGVWSATGVGLTAIISRVFFKEPFTWVMGLGLALIMGGVLLIEFGGGH
ncbi:QacE family quaternary ammonium compound efflux SMR transporter [Kocuria tytonicola]|uniref:QacE family quaternary ammonium compound efflux SMR transporter n=1 Tax=Kocuria tytonicola TaxID=2055946 RepID=A0A3L9L5D5_9MICC|nr:SMR family transporter [Kocuria tytonicola]RLY93781.1 QacE family quaternary ammonium compound efflux SMR transporter [Kocuria tytonicola]RLZ03941.1 QacE family quaternary ammonium compound efflux SMR transporter [Kocuria tytonicola]